MKHLVLGALFAVAASTGCTTTDDPIEVPTASVVTMKWEFFNLTSGTPRSCPTGYPVAEVVSQALDPNTHRPTGTTFVDTYDCSDGIGDLILPDENTYIFWVEIKSNSGQLYAQSQEFFIDTLLDDTLERTARILDDGGYFSLSWDLVDPDDRVITCAGAGANTVVVTATLTSSDAHIDTPPFRCDDHFGTTAGLPAGEYVVSLTAEDAGGPLNNTRVTATDTIEAPNKITDLGNFLIPID